MCSDKNGAPHTVRYLNAQLAVLHENARICLEEHDGTEENSEHDHLQLRLLSVKAHPSEQNTSTLWPDILF